MHITTLLQLAEREKLPPLQQRLLEYLEAHPGDVFEYRDAQLVREVGGKPSSVGFSLWALHKRELIDKETVRGRVYFGSKTAIGDLRAGLGICDEDPFEKATQNLRRIREQVGDLDILALLDETRGGA